jgi:hypothetical protein
LCHNLLEEALRLYQELIGNEAEYLSKSEKTKFDLTLELCQFISKYPSRATHLRGTTGEGILRQALIDYP